MKSSSTLVILFVAWLIWAAFSTGGLYELKQINPDYPIRDKNLADLISTLNYTSKHGWNINHAWDNFHVEMCSAYMPNWQKSATCVSIRKTCEYDAPKEKLANVDVFSKQYASCFLNKKPSLGLKELLHISRSFLRIGVSQGAFWLFGANSEYAQGKQKEWDKKNEWWAYPLVQWMDEGV